MLQLSEASIHNPPNRGRQVSTHLAADQTPLTRQSIGIPVGRIWGLAPPQAG